MTRLAISCELESVYLMGADVWANASLPEYLLACENSAKYRRGVWYVLVDESGALVSSLIVYRFSEGHFGIGSLATGANFRNRGHGSRLVLDVLRIIDEEFFGDCVFLYADIQLQFYERFGFVVLPKTLQKHSVSKCMVRLKTVDLALDAISVPDYF